MKLASGPMFIKVCGTTSEQDALLAVALGADAVGFVFAPSPRQVSPTTVADIVKRLPPEVATIGVFRNEAPTRVVEIVNRIGLRGAQLHGHETASQARWVRERVPFVIQAFAAGDPAIEHANDYGVDAIMIDSPSPGSGLVFDWCFAESPDGARLILGGGLTPDNVSKAIGQVRPWGVDVASGVEAAPGRKDPRKMRAFIAEVRATAEALAPPERTDESPFDWEDDEF